ncbi:MAG: YpdA family putative bacillithiol disulfide reductase [Bdellovibrionota bacterium]
MKVSAPQPAPPEVVYDTLVIGGGPIGLACGILLRRCGVRALILEKGSVADAVRLFPVDMTFFSTSELIELCGIPLISAGIRPTRFEALKYYSRVAESEKLEICRFTEVRSLRKRDDIFEAQDARGRTFRGKTAIFATGYYSQPNALGVPGETLPHVSHYYDEGLKYASLDVVVVGGQNSACDTALDLFRSGARVSLVHRGLGLGHSVKYWVRPDIENRMKAGEIKAHFGHRVAAITEQSVVIENIASCAQEELLASFVFLMTGYHPDVALLSDAGVSVDRESLIPQFDPNSFETNIKGLFVAGSITAGKRTSSIFIENGRVHAEVVARSVCERMTGANTEA